MALTSALALTACTVASPLKDLDDVKTVTVIMRKQTNLAEASLKQILESKPDTITISDGARLSEITAILESEAEGWSSYYVTLPNYPVLIALEAETESLTLFTFAPPCEPEGTTFHVIAQRLRQDENLGAGPLPAPYGGHRP